MIPIPVPIVSVPEPLIVRLASKLSVADVPKLIVLLLLVFNIKVDVAEPLKIPVPLIAPVIVNECPLKPTEPSSNIPPILTSVLNNG